MPNWRNITTKDRSKKYWPLKAIQSLRYNPANKTTTGPEGDRNSGVVSLSSSYSGVHKENLYVHNYVVLKIFVGQ